jgi:endonuclease/exonuclease/phosphatase (EEP) superfamily protein YafD
MISTLRLEAEYGKRRRRNRRLLAVASLVNLALIASAILVSHAQPDYEPPASMVAYTPQLVWVLLPVPLMLWSIAVMSWRALAFNLACWGLGALTLGGFVLPRPEAQPRDAQMRPLRVLTWNVQFQDERIGEIQGMIRNYSPDVVCLQEAGNPAFDCLLPGWYCTDADMGHHSGVRLLSRFPITSTKSVGGAIQGAVPSLVCEVRTPAGEVIVVSTHLKASHSLARNRGNLHRPRRALREGAQLRRRQVAELMSVLPSDTPSVLAGDFNSLPLSSVHRTLASRMVDVFGASGRGFGYTHLAKRRLPWARIDYIWCGDGVRPVRCTVGDAGPSDHRPVIAEVLLPPSLTLKPSR